MPPKRSSHKKRQTQLTFSPLPPSSSAADQLSPDVRDRAAAISYKGPVGQALKRRKLDFGKPKVMERADGDKGADEGSDTHGLPTPKKSFTMDGESDSEYSRAVQKSMKVGMSPNTKLGMFRSSDNEKLFSSSDSSSATVDEQEQERKQTRKKKGKKQKDKGKDKAEAKRLKKQKREEKASRKDKKRKREPSPEDVSSEEEEEPILKHTRSAKKLKRSCSNDLDSVPGQQSKSPPSLKLEPDTSDSDIMPDTTPIRRARKLANRHKRASSFEVPDDVVELESDDDEVIPLNSATRRSGPRQLSESEGDESEEKVKTPGRRFIRRRKPQVSDAQEQHDLEEDLEFLKSSPQPEKSRQKETARDKRQKALEAMKKRRAGSTAEPSSSAPIGKKSIVVVSDSDSDELEVEEEPEKELEHISEVEEQEEEDEDDSELDEIEARPHRSAALEMFQADEEDDSFIVQEDDNGDDALGAPAQAQLPLEFSSMSRAKPRDLFKFAVEWMVQKKINPAFSSNNEIYKLTFRKLNDEVESLATSKYTSSAWTPDFSRALKARPDVTIDEIGKAMRAIESPHCEACNRKTHPATWNVCFTGKPYNKETLEPEADESDDSSSSSSSLSSSDSESDSSSLPKPKRRKEKATYDAIGTLIPPESRVFTVGSTCKANAQMAHTLHHWRHHLNSWIVDYLIREKHCTSEKLVERDGWSVRKREKYANKVVDKMEKVGEIKKLHKLYRDQIDFALEAKNDYNRGWGRRG